LALYAANQTSGIAVNIGFQVTSVVPSMFYDFAVTFKFLIMLNNISLA